MENLLKTGRLKEIEDYLSQMQVKNMEVLIFTLAIEEQVLLLLKQFRNTTVEK